LFFLFFFFNDVTIFLSITKNSKVRMTTLSKLYAQILLDFSELRKTTSDLGRSHIF
jgi:hypothetical protein